MVNGLNESPRWNPTVIESRVGCFVVCLLTKTGPCNIQRFFVSKKKKFFCSKHRSWVRIRTALFLNKKNCISLYTPVFLYESGVLGSIRFMDIILMKVAQYMQKSDAILLQTPGPDVIKLHCSAQLSIKFELLINTEITQIN